MSHVAIDVKDAILVLRVLAGLDTSASIALEADVNGDNKLGFEEVFTNLRSIAG